MQFQLPFKITPSSVKMLHNDAVMLCGACFTEHIGNKMAAVKMNVCMNPQGVLFNPMSIAKCLEACIEQVSYQAPELFQLNEVWNHWDFHSRFSHTNKENALFEMNGSIEAAHSFLKQADWLIITLGSSFQYFLKEQDGGNAVANCHKAPGNWFEKRMLTIVEMQEQWTSTLDKLEKFNSRLKVVFTVSPVRHYRDGLIENNRSKARLFELISCLQEKKEALKYFPAFEIVNDILRDYRYFEPDMVHPSQQAVQFVWEQFTDTFFNQAAIHLMEQLKSLVISLQHKPRFAETAAHQKFNTHLSAKMDELKGEFSYLNFEKEKMQLQ